MFNKRSLQFWENGPSPGAFYNFPGSSFEAPHSHGMQRTSQPMTTGTSVVGIRYDEGVIISADNLVSYGSLARFHDIDRVFKVNDQTIIGAGGDYADFQYIKKAIDQKVITDNCLDDKNSLKPKSLYNWLTRILYNKRSKMEPLWLEIVVGGMQNGEPFLGHVSMRGRSYTDRVISTGYGSHLAIPLLREYSDHPERVINKPVAIELIKKSMEVLYYRDCRGHPKYSQAVCTAEGVTVEKGIAVAQNWELSDTVKGYN